MSAVTAPHNGEAASVLYINNAKEERVFTSEPQYGSGSARVGTATTGTQSAGFTDWLLRNLGWLFGKTSSTKTLLGTAYIYDEQGHLLGEYSNGGSLSTGRQEIIWLPLPDGQAMPIGLLNSLGLYAVHADHLNTRGTLAVYPPVRAPGHTLAFPRTRATTPALTLNLRYPGQYFDAESNLFYNYQRVYQPTTGRYTQPDPIGLGGGLNRFGYVGGNVLSNVDPWGLCSCIARTDIDNKSADKFEKFIGDERVVKGQYQCTADDGKKSSMVGTHKERYYTSWDDGRRGNVLGQTYASPPTFIYGKGPAYTQSGYQSFDPLRSISPELRAWASSCGCK